MSTGGGALVPPASSAGRAVFCALCGRQYLFEHDDGAISCAECVREWPSRRAYLRAIVSECRRWWAGLDNFTRAVLREPDTERALRRVAIGALAAGCDPDVLETILSASNSLRPRPVPIAELERIQVEAAHVVAAARRRVA